MCKIISASFAIPLYVSTSTIFFTVQLAISSACINPFLYCWFNESFCKALNSMKIKIKSNQNNQNTPAVRTVENRNTTTYKANNALCPTVTTAGKTFHSSNYDSNTNTIFTTNLLTVHETNV